MFSFVTFYISYNLFTVTEKGVWHFVTKAKFWSMPMHEGACDMSGFDQAMMDFTYHSNTCYSNALAFCIREWV